MYINITIPTSRMLKKISNRENDKHKDIQLLNVVKHMKNAANYGFQNYQAFGLKNENIDVLRGLGYSVEKSNDGHVISWE